ncbi:gamma-glutamyltransferase family protein [Domibacillus indicus]|uniref:gamma-glutamyltransferase family protein n=1 Tax=Domibacillus indicus TaxID=1437523 RepID=UPI000617FBD4|nr:gamma-glutamyltransferase family protein [Domibacillus indicus]
MNTDVHYNPYRTKREPVFARRGVVATAQPLAAQAGLDMLKKGGNAVDAAIAAAACLTVLEPTSNSLGGDAFAIVSREGKLHGLNASGPAPHSISIDELNKRGHKEMPKHGVEPITVPGAPSAWAALSKKFGRLPFEQLFEPAIYYAEHGYAVSPVVAAHWQEACKEFKKALTEPVFEEWFRVFAPEGCAPLAGEIWRSPDHAKTLRAIAQTGGEDYYRGETAAAVAAHIQSSGGFLAEEDLARYQPEWVDPVSIRYRDYEVWELPPNGQGMIALMALNMLNGLSFSAKEELDSYHKPIEAMKLAFADGEKYITDRSRMTASEAGLLAAEYAEQRRALIGPEASEPAPGEPPYCGTVYLAAADEDGMMVSFIQSSYTDFGSGVVVPGTGICLQNRGHNFSLNPAHQNALEGGKKTYHTIIPGFLTKNGVPVGPFGVMGGFMQPQGHVQVLMNMIDFQLNPQAALDAPRWQWIKKKELLLEPAFSEERAQQLNRLGHNVSFSYNATPFGRGQIIIRNAQTGVYCAGTETRADGAIASW